MTGVQTCALPICFPVTIGPSEVITAKQRQGEIGTTALTYIGNQTRFDDLAFQWKPMKVKEPKDRGFD